MMTRINMASTNKLGYAAVLGMEAYSSTSVDRRLYELIKLRASIVNGCGYCVDMHATDGAKRGIPQRTLHAVGAWQHARGFFSEAEQAALALTDAITKIGPDSVTDDIWNDAAAHFDAGELGAIVMAICTINVWNRIAIATEMAPPVDTKHPIV